jgi:phosphoglycerol transferase
MDNGINFAHSSLRKIIRSDWRWWLFGAALSTILPSVLIAGWPTGLLPNIDYPFTYNGDGFFIAIQRLIEGWIFENPRSGYPFGSSLLDYPASDSGNYLILKLLGAIAGHWYSVFNIYYLLGFAVTFVVAFLVLRAVGLAIPFAFTAAMLFNFLPFHFQRIDHTFYTWYFVVPVFYYVALRIFNPISLKEIADTTAWQKFIFAVCLIGLGSFGVYYAIFGLIILSVIVISSLAKRRNDNSFKISLIASSFVVFGVILNLAPNLIHQQLNGKNPEVAQRGIGESEIYAFKFVQLILPRSGHRSHSLGEVWNRYSGATPWVNENSTSTLGMVGFLYCVLFFQIWQEIDKTEH